MKSKLINKLISLDHETFWHEELPGGDLDQRVSGGMAEVAWYLPSGQPAVDHYQRAVGFTNLRGPAMDSPKICTQFLKSSSIVCIFAEKVDRELRTFLQQNKENLHKILLIIHPPQAQLACVSEECRRLMMDLQLLANSLIVNPAVDRKFNRTLGDLKEALNQKLDSHPEHMSLADLLRDLVTNTDINSDEGPSATGRRHTNDILQDIEHLYEKGGTSPKVEVLPCSSDLAVRQAIADIDKDLCRQKRMSSTESPSEFIEKMQEKKWDLQQKQLKQQQSEPFRNFRTSLSTLSPVDRKYFLQALRLGLNEKSVKILQPIREEYEKERSKKKQKEEQRTMENKLAELSKKLVHASFGIEHFFREMAVWYENLAALNNRMQEKPLQPVLTRLAGTMALLLNDSTALEVFDGDSMHVPHIWIKAVLEELEKRSPMRVFKVSALGAQSSGKSTLLNTMFGLNFPVSAGHCTRGAYIQLVRMDAKMKKRLDCDNLLVIDSEGLMSSELVDSNTHDNELATFIIGLSDLTLVIFKQEGDEMKSVLPIAVLAFMRMNLIGEKQACHFVRQNMGAVEAAAMNQLAVDMFVNILDEATATAAKSCQLEDINKYTCFSDVLHYDKNTDNTYVPGLWKGTPPMAKPNKGYSVVVQELKSQILQRLDQVRRQGKECSSLKDFSTWLGDLWDGIKYENFIFSFRNVLAMDAYRNLANILDDQKRIMKKEIKKLTKERTTRLWNQQFPNRAKLTEVTDTEKGAVETEISTKISNLREQFVHFFQCTEENCMDKERHKHLKILWIKNKHLIADNEKGFMDDIENLRRELEAELERDFNNAQTIKLAQITITELDNSMEQRILDRVKEKVKDLKDQELGDDEKRKIFNALWEEETKTVQRQIDKLKEPPRIQAVVHQCIKELLNTSHELPLFNKKERRADSFSKKERRAGQNQQASGKQFTVKNSHVTAKNLGRRMWNLVGAGKPDLHHVQQETDNIVEAARRRYAWKEEGELFTKATAEDLFKEVIDGMKKVKDEYLTVGPDYTVDLIRFIKADAVPAFEKLHKRYEERSSSQAMLNEKRDHYERRFLMELNQGGLAVNFAHTVLKSIILENLDDPESTCSKEELLDDLVNNMRRFRNSQTLHASVLVDLYRGKNFGQFMDFVSNFSNFMRRLMVTESLAFFSKNERLKKHGQSRVEKIIGTLREHLMQTTESTEDGVEFILTFLESIEGLKLPPTRAYEGISVNDPHKFTGMALEQLNGAIREEVLGIVDQWKVSDQLRRRGMHDFLFSELIGCGKRCPFCKAPCDIHRGSSSGDHMTKFHRPKGTGGMRYHITCSSRRRHKLVTEDCSYAVTSDSQFHHHNEKWIPYKKYREVYPKWSIQGNPDPDVEKYWKWFFATYNKNLAEYFHSNFHEVHPANIPESWDNITQEEVLKDVETKYNVTVNRDTLTIE